MTTYQVEYADGTVLEHLYKLYSYGYCTTSSTRYLNFIIKSICASSHLHSSARPSSILCDTRIMSCATAAPRIPTAVTRRRVGRTTRRSVACANPGRVPVVYVAASVVPKVSCCFFLVPRPRIRVQVGTTVLYVTHAN